MSCACWFLATSVQASKYLQTSTAVDSLYAVQTDGSSLLQISVRTNTGTQLFAFASVTFPTGWFHVAVTRNGSSDWKFYLNGTLTETVNNAGLCRTDPLALGTWSTTTMAEKFYDWAIWQGTEISAAEITSLWDGSKRPNTIADTPTLYMNLSDQTTGTVAGTDTGLQDKITGTVKFNSLTGTMTWDTDFPTFSSVTAHNLTLLGVGG